MGVVVPAEVLEAKRRDRDERERRWPPGPLLGEDLDAEVIELKVKERKTC